MPAVRHTSRRTNSKLPVRPLGADPQSVRRTERDTTPRVVIATDGSRAAAAAMKFARLMAEKGAWSPEVVTVLMPLPVSVGDMMLPAPSVHYETIVTDSVAENIRRQVRRYGDGSWDLAIEFGRPAPVIVRLAHDRKANLIVLGLGHHGPIARLFGAETAIRVVRHTDIPVLAVHSSARSLPSVAVAAVDFSDASVRAAREALALVEPPGRLHLVHVRGSHNLTSFADSEWERAYAVAAQEEFGRLLDRIGSREGVQVTTVLLSGIVTEKVLREAAAVRAGLIAVGSHSQNVLDRMIVGSTPAQILRASPCSVLVAPPESADV